MSSTASDGGTMRRCAAHLNEQIRRLADDRTDWTTDDLSELARLWAQWQAAASGAGSSGAARDA